MNTFRSPSAKALDVAFPGKGSALKRILRMTRDELDATPVGDARNRECYHRPYTSDVRLHCLNAEAGTHGVEAFTTKAGRLVEYLNTGDTYAPTLVWFRGHYRIASWGDLAERYGSL